MSFPGASFRRATTPFPLLAVMVAAFVVVNNDILHWIALGIFAPLAKANLTMACIAALLYLLFLGHFFQPDR